MTELIRMGEGGSYHPTVNNPPTTEWNRKTPPIGDEKAQKCASKHTETCVKPLSKPTTRSGGPGRTHRRIGSYFIGLFVDCFWAGHRRKLERVTDSIRYLIIHDSVRLIHSGHSISEISVKYRIMSLIISTPFSALLMLIPYSSSSL